MLRSWGGVLCLGSWKAVDKYGHLFIFKKLVLAAVFLFWSSESFSKLTWWLAELDSCDYRTETPMFLAGCQPGHHSQILEDPTVPCHVAPPWHDVLFLHDWRLAGESLPVSEHRHNNPNSKCPVTFAIFFWIEASHSSCPHSNDVLLGVILEFFLAQSFHFHIH